MDTTATRSRRRQGGSSARRDRFDLRLSFNLFVFDYRSGRGSSRRLVAIFCQGFAGEQDRLFGWIDRHRWARAARMLWAAILKSARFGAAVFEVAGLSAAVLVTTGFTTARFALRRSVFGRRKIAACGTTLRTSTATASTATPKTSAPTALTTAVVAAIVASVVAAAITLALTITAGTRRVVLRWIVMWREILWSGSVRIRLALVVRVDGSVIVGRFHSVANPFVMIFVQLAGLAMQLRGLRIVMSGFVTGAAVLSFPDGLVVMRRGATERFAREKLDRMNLGGHGYRRGGVRGFVTMSVVVVFEIFEDVADV